MSTSAEGERPSIYVSFLLSDSAIPDWPSCVANLAYRTVLVALIIHTGTDVDPTHWDMSERDVYDRRCFYYNLLQADPWQVSWLLYCCTINAISDVRAQSTYSGRPPALAESMGDCKVPSEADEEKFQEGEYAIGCKSVFLVIVESS